MVKEMVPIVSSCVLERKGHAKLSYSSVTMESWYPLEAKSLHLLLFSLFLIVCQGWCSV